MRQGGRQDVHGENDTRHDQRFGGRKNTKQKDKKELGQEGKTEIRN